jgi:hypothetical protein
VYSSPQVQENLSDSQKIEQLSEAIVIFDRAVVVVKVDALIDYSVLVKLLAKYVTCCFSIWVQGHRNHDAWARYSVSTLDVCC